ncbi:hypothetical protein F3Y22_tig00117000pilonHSYRG00074 [Hibiscus syriacus]|uniref:Uncharacterized protein n=1 Tax=Hibiscus syriacus TaxID=106335 RepID=A0A6A2XJ51_HIBSY|nr:hypothetical protein F3Y22_tig00117000pilonHSYRG00074 [Hibiscus syriacus]
MECKRPTAPYCQANTGHTAFSLRIRWKFLYFLHFSYTSCRWYGAIHLYNLPAVPIPFPPTTVQRYAVLIGDWYNADYRNPGAPDAVGGTEVLTYFKNTMIAWISMSDNLTRYHSAGDPVGPLPLGPFQSDYNFSLDQARSMRWNLTSSAARPNPQGSYHYGNISISRTLILENNLISMMYSSTVIHSWQTDRYSSIFVYFVIDALYCDFFHIVFQNPLLEAGCNMVDAVSITVQVYPLSWTAILIELDTWDVESEVTECRELVSGARALLIVKGAWEDGRAPFLKG